MLTRPGIWSKTSNFLNLFLYLSSQSLGGWFLTWWWGHFWVQSDAVPDSTSPQFFLCLLPESSMWTCVCVCVCVRDWEGEVPVRRRSLSDPWVLGPDQAPFLQPRNPHKHRLPSPRPLQKAGGCLRRVVCTIVRASARFTATQSQPSGLDCSPNCPTGMAFSWAFE